MPIRPDLLHFYKTPEYQEAREKCVERAKGRCQDCGKMNGRQVETVTRINARGVMMVWRPRRLDPWRDQRGRLVKRLGILSAIRRSGKPRSIRVVCTMAHLNHDPSDNRDSNVRFLCGWCHLNYDKSHHKESRQIRKDAGRDILCAASPLGAPKTSASAAPRVIGLPR